jgi:uncharacterized protein (DUF1501 family)
VTTTRRELLRLGLGGSTLLACGATVPTFLARSAHALTDAPGRVADGRILVVVQLDGGNDGLNTVVPHGDDVYHKSRPKLALKAAGLRPIDDHVGLHPSLDGFAKLRDDGRLAIVQSVGYPNPNRSHFESMAVWHTARLGPGREEPGWLARSIDAGPSAPGGDAPALHVAAGELPQALRGGRQHVPSLATAEQFRRRLGVPEADGADEQRAALDRIASGRPDGDGENPLLQFVARSTVVSYTSSARIEGVLRDDDDAAKYPDSYGLARRLRLIARLIRAGLSTSIYYVQLGGFDTHAEQLNRHSGLLRELGGSVRAFLADLDRSGDGDRVAMLVFSEFGRRLRENASAGTDHGTSAPVFLLGRPVQGGLHGPYPDLGRLRDGDPEHAIDFRRVYAAVLERWLRLPAEATLETRFEPMPLFHS